MLLASFLTDFQPYSSDCSQLKCNICFYSIKPRSEDHTCLMAQPRPAPTHYRVYTHSQCKYNSLSTCLTWTSQAKKDSHSSLTQIFYFYKENLAMLLNYSEIHFYQTIKCSGHVEIQQVFSSGRTTPLAFTTTAGVAGRRKLN